MCPYRLVLAVRRRHLHDGLISGALLIDAAVLLTPVLKAKAHLRENNIVAIAV
jgi:hypothetical protein